MFVNHSLYSQSIFVIVYILSTQILKDFFADQLNQKIWLWRHQFLAELCRLSCSRKPMSSAPAPQAAQSKRPTDGHGALPEPLYGTVKRS